MPLMLKLTLAVLNTSLLCYILATVFWHVRYQHNFRSWSMAFNLSSFIWLALRELFWLRTIIISGLWNPVTLYTLYWMPHPIQFGSYLILPLFYMQIISKNPSGSSLWDSRWQCMRIVYIIAVTLMLLFIMGGGIVVELRSKEEHDCLYHYNGYTNYNKCYHNEMTLTPVRYVVAGCFIFLSLVLALLQFQLMRLESTQTYTQVKQFLTTNLHTLGILNCVLFLAFLSKGMYELITIFGVAVLPRALPLTNGSDLDRWTFTCFLIWEYLPTTLILATVSSQTSGRRDNSRQYLHESAFRYIKEPQPIVSVTAPTHLTRERRLSLVQQSMTNRGSVLMTNDQRLYHSCNGLDDIGITSNSESDWTITHNSESDSDYE